MAMYLFCKWANLNTTQGKHLIDKLIKLALKKVAILETLDLGWLKLGLKKLYRAKQGDKKLFMDVMTEFDSLLKFNLPQKLSISIFRELMKCNQTNSTNVVEKYSIFLEFKKNLLYKKICLTQIT